VPAGQIKIIVSGCLQKGLCVDVAAMELLLLVRTGDEAA
jgi:hypothetical protein